MDRETFLEILKKGKMMRASDIHLLAGEVPVFRINGKLIRIEEYNNFTKEDMKNLSSFVVKEEDREFFERNRELDFSFRSGEINSRINIFYERENIGMSIRLVREEPFTLEELGINKKIYDILEKKQGLIIVSGKSGSGKSSTLAGIIEKFNREENLNILTIEDPVEYIFKALSQQMVDFDEK
jgi:twitching motility protein PilT